MNDSKGENGGFSVGQRVALLVIGFALLAGVVFVSAQVTTNSYHVGEGTTYVTSSGLEVVLGEDIQTDRVHPMDSDSVDLGDEVTLHSTGFSRVEASGLQDTWLVLNNLNVSQNTLEVDAQDQNDVSISGGVTSLEIRDMTVADGSNDVRINATSATLVIEELPTDESLILVDSNGDAVASDSTGSSGTATFSISHNGGLRLEESSDSTIGDPNPGDDETVSDPTISNAGPANTTQYNVSISVDVDDPDYYESWGDNVTVEFYESDGTLIGTNSTTSAATVSTSWDNLDMGPNDWYVVASDAYGNSFTSQTFTVHTPNELHLRDEQTQDLITNANGTVTFYPDAEDEAVVTRSATNGTVLMDGLPGNSGFIADASADGYNDRTVHIDDVTVQNNIYLLENNASTVEVRFVLEDETGTFGPDSRLNIKKVINVSGEERYRTIASDEFGVEGVTTILEQGARYRIELVNRNGVTQSIGPYRADISETVTIRPREATISVEGYERGWGAEAVRNNDTIIARYDDPENQTDSVTVTVHERGNKSNTLTGPDTFVNQQEVDISYTLTGNETETEWAVTFDVERNGETTSVTRFTTERPDSVPGGLGDVWRTIFGVAAMLIFGGVFSVLNRAVGGIMVGLVGGILWWTGWLSGATTGMAIAIYLMIAVLYTIHVNRV